MLNPFIDLINNVIDLINNVISLINIAIIVWAVLGLLMNLDIINRYNPIVQRIYSTLSRLLEPMLRPIRNVTKKHLPDLGGVDLSPIILLILLNFISSLLHDWFYTY